MNKERIREIIERTVTNDGLTATGIDGVQLFRATTSVPCMPAVYDPCVIAIVSGSKEAVLDGQHHIYDSQRYLCCPMSMPVEAGTPNASPENPLFGVYVSLNHREMSGLTLELDNASAGPVPDGAGGGTQGVRLAEWDTRFADALLRLVQVLEDPVDMAVLGQSRMREVLYAVLKGEAGAFARAAFGPGNAIARSIALVADDLQAPVTIDDMAARAGMSRAAFHRKFKQATTLSPIQFVKSMRLNHAAMQIAGGMSAQQAAVDAGYVSASQFGREFKRHYGQSPKQWSAENTVRSGLI